MRSFPGWQPLDEPQAGVFVGNPFGGALNEVCRQSVRPSQAVLPTALEMPEDAAMAARRIDALIVGVLTVGPGTQVVGCRGACRVQGLSDHKEGKRRCVCVREMSSRHVP